MPEVRLRGLAWRWATLVAACAVLVRCGRILPGPPLGGPGALRAWTERSPVDVLAAGVVRELTLVAGAYLAVVVTVGLVGHLCRHQPTWAIAARLSPPGLRAALCLAAAAAVTGAALVPASTAGAAGGPGPALWRVAPSAPPAARHRGGGSASPPARPPSVVRPPALWRVRGQGGDSGRPGSGRSRDTGRPGDGRPEGTSRPGIARAGETGRPGTPQPVRRPTPPPAGRPGASTTRRVRPGDDFWSIAAEQVARVSGGRPPTSAAVSRYWLVLVRANRDRLAIPGDANLLFPGQEILVPPVPGPATPT